MKSRIGNRLRVFRAERRWTQWEVARRARIPKYRYWAIENEQTEPTVAERRRLARVLGADPTAIWPVPSPEVAR